jgi:hypothetical protein
VKDSAWLPAITTDEASTKVIVNIVLNAADAMPTGTLDTQQGAKQRIRSFHRRK